MMVSRFYLCLYLINCVYSIVSSQDGLGPVINTQQGTIQGTWRTTINGRKIQSFMSIPYAKPPVGSRRFKKPEPFGSWLSIHDGSVEPPICPQLGMMRGVPTVVGDEDCLYLNVYAPNTTEDIRYPVMVFMHGGGFLTGTSSPNLYGPDMLLEKDVVLVVFNYRIGILGFASTEDSEMPGNFGLKDQNLALKWVQENIANYGGDPNNVTIFGVCSGGSSVHYHMLSPLSKGLFHRAIVMSGTAYSPWAISAPKTVANYLMRTGVMLNCNTMSSKDLVSCLLKVPANVLIESSYKFIMWEGMEPALLYTPVFEAEGEDSFITAKSYMSQTTMPMIIGVTSDEAALKLAEFHHSSIGFNKVLSRLDKNFINIAPISLMFKDKASNPPDVAMKIKDYFFKGKRIDRTTIPEIIKMYSDAFYYVGTKNAVKNHDGPSYLYIFAYRGEQSMSELVSGRQFRYGAAHADELQYLFPFRVFPSRTGLNKEDIKVSQQLVDYFTNFAIYGMPASNWTATSMPDYNYLLINGTDTEMKTNFLQERDDFWQNLEWMNNLITL